MGSFVHRSLIPRTATISLQTALAMDLLLGRIEDKQNHPQERGPNELGLS